MLERIRNIWHPENFHYAHALGRRRGFFEGWYFKLVDPGGARPLAIIPGIFLGRDAHCFVQVLDGRAGRSWYHRFPVEDFHADPRRFDIRIRRSRFHATGLSLDIEADETQAKQQIRGEVGIGAWSPWPVRFTSPGVMGPYGFTPFMQCYHGILSLDHALDGALEIDGAAASYAGGRGYLEKDWGRGFPLGYVWIQSNHFGQEGICLTASVARVPWITGAFRGLIGGFLWDGRLHRFTTYTGAQVEHLELQEERVGMVLADRRHRIELEARRTEPAPLHAPYDRHMLERVSETMTSEVELRFSTRGGERLFEGLGRHGCLEIQGDLASLPRS